jgi:DNA-binding GntR family transcriptional regulator
MKNDSPAPATGSALVDEIAAAIRGRIMSGEIAIGAQLRQAELASELGVSRTPVREALRQLQSGGLIEVVPNRGAIVRVPVPWEVREAYLVRAQLEGFACELAVRQITTRQLETLRETNRTMREATFSPQDPAPSGEAPTTSANDVFHTTIHEASGNRRLARTINEINETFPRNVSALVLADDQRHREENVREHERITDAIADGDAATARREMIAHVEGAGEQLARWYERRSSTVFVG